MNTDLRDKFDEDGFVICRQFHSVVQVNEILFEFNRFIRNSLSEIPPEHVFYEDKSNKDSLKQIQRLHEWDPFFGKLMMDGPFRQLAEELLRSEVTCENMQYFNKPPGFGQPTPAHQDGFYFKLEPCEAVTLWFALDSVDKENGCIRYVPGSHKNGMRPHQSTSTLGFSQGIVDFPNRRDAATEFGISAAPGDLLAHHALTVHRAAGNRSMSRSRRALGFIYYSVHAKQDRLAWLSYQQELVDELKSAGRI